MNDFSPDSDFARSTSASFKSVAKELGCKLVGIGGGDICNSNKKLILAIVWQLMRAYTIKLLTDLGGGTKQIEDKQIIAWVRCFCGRLGACVRAHNKLAS
jgi:hypothetical protein